MGNQPVEQKERNLELCNDYFIYKRGGYTMADLVKKYGITQQRINQIWDKKGVKQKLKK